MKYSGISLGVIRRRIGRALIYNMSSVRIDARKKRGKNGFFYLPLVLLLWSTGCAGVPSAHKDSPFQPEECTVTWRVLCPGIETADISCARLPLIAHAVKVDLHHPAISIVTTESSRFRGTQGLVLGETTLEFAERLHTAAACNAAPFRTSSLLFSRYRTAMGIHITDYSRMSAPNARCGALLFYADKTARIVETKTEAAFPAEVCHALGGYWMILRDGAVLPQKLERRDSRMAVGLAADGSVLYLLAIEGEWKGYSRGLSYTETAVLLRALGASDALQFDGGSSSSLVLREHNEQRLIAPSCGWNIRIPVASNLGIVYTEPVIFIR